MIFPEQENKKRGFQCQESTRAPAQVNMDIYSVKIIVTTYDGDKPFRCEL